MTTLKSLDSLRVKQLLMQTHQVIWEYHFDFRPISKDNCKIRNKRGMYFLPREYKEFEKKIKDCVKGMPKITLTEDMVVHLFCSFKDKRRPDTSNLPKSIFDALNKLIWEDDKGIYKVVTEIQESCQDSFCVSILEPSSHVTLSS